MNYLFLLSFGGLSFCKKKSKWVLLFGFVVLWGIFALNYSNPDFASYERQYQTGQNLFFTEPLYTGLMTVCRGLGLDFRAFVAIESFIGIFLICLVVIKLSPYPNPVIFLYSIFPFYLDVVQTRSFLAEAFLLAAIAAIVKYSESRLPLYFGLSIIMILFACGCHYSALLYITILVLLLYSEKHNNFFFCIMPVALLLAPIILKYFLPIASGFIGGHKTFLWLSKMKSPTIAHMIRLIAIRLGLAIIVLFLRKYMERSRINEKQNDIMLLAYLYLSLNVVFELYLNSAFERMTRPALIMGNIVLTRYISQTENHDNRKILWFIMVIHNVLYLLSSLYYYKSGDLSWIEFVFRAVFEKNLLWS